MAARPRISTTARCGVCPFQCNSTVELDVHIERMHKCICGDVFLDKALHNCDFSDDEETLQVGSGLITIPQDAYGNPVFEVGKNAYKDVIMSFIHKYHEHVPDIVAAVNTMHNYLEDVIRQYLRSNKAIRLKLWVQVIMYSPKDGKEVVREYPSKPYIVSHVNYIDDQIHNCTKYLVNIMKLMSQELSGLLLRRVKELEISILKFNGLPAEGYLPLGEHFKRKQGLLNIKNKCGGCFAYSVAGCIHYKDFLSEEGKTLDEAKGYDRQKLQRKLENPNTFQKFVDGMSYIDAEYGENLDMVDVFEAANDISVSIVKHSKKTGTVIPIRLTKVFKTRHVFLLLISRDELDPCKQPYYSTELHFVSILNPVVFLALKSLRYNGVCRFCFSNYRSNSHEQRCFDNDMVSLSMPKTKYFRFNDHHKLTVPPTFFVYSFLFGNTKDKIRVDGFCLIGFNADFEMIYSRTEVGKNSLNIFLDELMIHGEYYLRQNSEKQIPLRPTAKSLKMLRETTNCPICGTESKPSNKFVQHHSHFSSLINGEKVEGHKPGNPSLIICNSCNLLVKERKRIMVYGYNISNHAQIFLRHIDRKSLHKISITPMRSADKYGSIMIGNTIQIVDMANHIGGASLRSLMQQVDNDDLHYLSLISRNESEFSDFKKGLPYPSFVTSFPSFENFTDLSQLNDLTLEDYNHAKCVYEAYEFKNLEEYGTKSAQVDAHSLASLVVNYAKFAMKFYSGLCPLWDISISGFSFSALHYIAKSKYKTLDDAKIIKAVESSLLPGVSFSNVRHQTFRNPELGDDFTETENCYCIYADVRSQYLSILFNPLPVDEYHYWSDAEVSEFDVTKFNDTNEIGYMINCSLTYPDKLHDFSDDLPYAYCRNEIIQNSTDQHGNRLDENELQASNLDLSLHDKKNIWLSLKNLKMFLALGLVLDRISGIISFKVSCHLAPFAEKCVAARVNAKNNFYANLAKVIPNVAVGKFTQRKNSVRVTIPSSQRAAERLIASSSFIDACAVGSNIALFYMQRKKGLPVQNTLIAWSVLQQSSYQLYDMVYNHLKRLWGNRVYVLYGQTDSVIARVHNVPNFLGDLEKIKHIFDLSTFPKSLVLHEDTDKYSAIGKWKIEMFYVREFVSFRTKSYSILEELPECSHGLGESCSQCSRVKGIQLQKISHETYKHILQRNYLGEFKYKSVKHDRDGRLLVSNNSRIFLSKSDNNRVWISPNESRARGHYCLRI